MENGTGMVLNMNQMAKYHLKVYLKMEKDGKEKVKNIIHFIKFNLKANMQTVKKMDKESNMPPMVVLFSKGNIFKIKDGMEYLMK